MKSMGSSWENSTIQLGLEQHTFVQLGLKGLKNKGQH